MNEMVQVFPRKSKWQENREWYMSTYKELYSRYGEGWQIIQDKDVVAVFSAYKKARMHYDSLKDRNSLIMFCMGKEPKEAGCIISDFIGWSC